MIKQQNGKYHLYSKDGSKHLGGPYDTREEAEEREREVNYFKAKKAGLVEVTLTITKASLQPDGTMRWQATTSDTSPDNTGEATSIALFQDFIERIEKGVTVDYLPPPRKPFLGVSHYPDLDGDGEAGATDKIYIDGNRLKSSGVFRQTSLGRALFDAVKAELDLIKRGEIVEKPIRISAAWWDIQHSHGSFVFSRKSLADVCPMCAKNEGNKVYLKGQLDHWASTRVPINPRTSLALEEKAMTKVTREEDAASIVGLEEAEKLETKSRLVGKAETETAIVVKAKAKKDEPIDDDEDTEGEEAKAKDAKKPKKADVERMEEAEYIDPDTDDEPAIAMPLGGAFTLRDAKAHMMMQEKLGRAYGNLEVMRMVQNNIMHAMPPEAQLGAIKALTEEMYNEMSAIKAAVEDIWLVQPLQEIDRESEVSEMDFLNTFSSAVTEALESDQPKEQKAAVIQEALNGLAGALKAELEGPPSESAEIAQAIKAAVEPLVQAVAQLNARLGVAQPVQQPAVTLPVQKSATMPQLNTQQPAQQQLPLSPITGQPSTLTAQIRRSVGLM